jgi:hypothetical protein
MEALRVRLGEQAEMHARGLLRLHDTYTSGLNLLG